MDERTFLLIYYFMTGLYVLAGIAVLLGKTRWFKVACSAGLSMNILIFLLIIFSARRLPIFGDFESITTITLVLGFFLLSNILRKPPAEKSFLESHAKWTCATIILLLIYLGFFPKTLNQDFYMYDDLRVIIFFHFRILASALFLYAALTLWSSLYYKETGYFHMARNFLLTGAAIFLISEFFGSLWCLNWFGDSWHWSRGFLKASCLFLLVMLASHIPPGWNVSFRMRSVIGSFPAAVSLWVLFLH